MTGTEPTRRGLRRAAKGQPGGTGRHAGNPAVHYYCIRQARTKIIGSRSMTLDEAGREAAIWRDEIGPATVVVADAASRKAVRTEDQAALARLLEWGPA